MLNKIELELKEYASQNKLTNYVFNDLMDCLDDYEGETWLEKLKKKCSYVVREGCVNGTVPSLIYYKDTLSFFETYKSEIKELLKDIPENYLITNILNGDIFIDDDRTKNNLAWLTYEEITSRILSILEELE